MSTARTIWKFPLAIKDVQQIEIPRAHRFLTVQMQHRPCLWVEVGPDVSAKLPVKVLCVGTGHPFDASNAEYIGTVQDDIFVWHFYAVVGGAK
jgi:hypothetical protein